MAGTFAKNSLDWQLQKLSQQAGEWIESWLPNRVAVPETSPSLPAWFLHTLFWVVALGLIVWAGWQLYRLFQPSFQSAGEREPVVCQPSVADWLNQAKAAHQQGDYQAACRALYLGALQRLSDQELIPQQLSRTDGEYLTLLRSLHLAQPMQTPYQTLIRIHERLYFDRVVASAELYDRCWQAYEQIAHRLARPDVQPRAQSNA